jgi:hypothetical protein
VQRYCLGPTGAYAPGGRSSFNTAYLQRYRLGTTGAVTGHDLAPGGRGWTVAQANGWLVVIRLGSYGDHFGECHSIGHCTRKRGVGGKNGRLVVDSVTPAA